MPFSGFLKVSAEEGHIDIRRKYSWVVLLEPFIWKWFNDFTMDEKD